ncbi:hypothetical protein QR680_006046 [Steinernema hermaphroditum]|uniref:Nuclear receptor domain-containing protein n=1 Tax=Steinernema hermaphroditum TaxID=289476 RepID=A0AA39HWF2_9BILA|nr:hypothetical protein QR680_006046 [Steinernema hermaphroditum]
MSLSPTAASPLKSEGRRSQCAVCGAKSHGFHFHVNSCRACAAFFRRSVESDGRKYRCRTSKFDCDVSKDATVNCRYCRYQRCKEVGMTTDGLRIQGLERESSCPDVMQQQSCSRSPSELSSNESLKDFTDSYEFKVDSQSQMTRLKHIITIPCWQAANASTMENLCNAFRKVILAKRPQPPQIVQSLDFTTYMDDFYDFMERSAYWTMGCPEFAHLPVDDRWNMYCNFWPVMFALERSLRTVESFGKNVHPNVFLMMEDKAVDMATFEFIYPNADALKIKAINDHFKPLNLMMLNNFVVPFKTLNLTVFEVVFLCAQKLFSVQKVKGLAVPTYEFANRMLDVISNELHHYYVKELRSDNYASRLSKLLGLLADIEAAFRFRNAKVITADLYNIYRCDYNNTDIYESGRNF